MLGVKLRSEKIDQFDVLGERGQAIHLVASQILTVLKNKRPDLLVNFAVPQPSENGRRIDWYAPTPGSVISWNAATATEQAGALVRLDAVRAGVAQLRDSVLAKGSGNDAALLGQLLKWILHHPDSSFVFLVDGQPVITFWGFVHNGADRTLDPLHALRPAVPVAAPVRAPAVETAAATTTLLDATLERRPWWKRWWLWLALLLLLLALLFGLRACAPNLVPGLSLPGSAPRDATLPDVKLSTPSLPHAGTSGMGIPGGAALTGSGTGGDFALPGAQRGAASVANAPASVDAPAVGTLPPGVAANGDAKLPAQSAVEGPGTLPSRQAAQGADEHGYVAPPTLPDSHDDLRIPTDARDGNADFLNGNWRAGAGIQDRDTGEPLRLHYQFKNGEGQVTVNRHNGVQCAAPVSAAVDKGALSISNSVAARCTDGGTYDMPLIQCKPGMTNIASCAGNYGNESFPISMRRVQP
ncbi:SrfA family protein [Achromobacter xylosoxidans]